MPIYLKKEYETEIEGTGDGFIRISQIKESNEEVVIWLSINQFQTIFNHEKYLNDEALKNDEPS